MTNEESLVQPVEIGPYQNPVGVEDAVANFGWPSGLERNGRPVAVSNYLVW